MFRTLIYPSPGACDYSILVRCVLEFRCGRVGVVSMLQASAWQADRQTDLKLLIDFRNFVSARNLNGGCNITNALSFSVDGQVKISSNQVRESVGYAPVCSHRSLLGNPRLKPTGCAGALSWRWKQLLVLHFSGRFLLTASLRRRNMSMYISFFTVGRQ